MPRNRSTRQHHNLSPAQRRKKNAAVAALKPKYNRERTERMRAEIRRRIERLSHCQWLDRARLAAAAPHRVVIDWPHELPEQAYGFIPPGWQG